MIETNPVRQVHSRAAQATQAFKDSVRHWADKIGVTPRSIYVQNMTTKWASCSNHGRISFSTDILHEDKEFQTVVIVHELIHLLVRNHGKLFKSLMNAYVPGWERISKGRVARLCGYHDPDTSFRRKPTRTKAKPPRNRGDV